MDHEEAITKPPQKIKRIRFLEIFNESKSIIDWSKDERCVVNYKVLHDRISKGWNYEKALTTPARKII
jgi:hypothetical protein